MPKEESTLYRIDVETGETTAVGTVTRDLPLTEEQIDTARCLLISAMQQIASDGKPGTTYLYLGEKRIIRVCYEIVESH